MQCPPNVKDSPGCHASPASSEAGPPPPPAREGAKYAPRSGDKVRCVDFDDYDPCIYVKRNDDGTHGIWSLKDSRCYWATEVFYLGPSTPAERSAAGIEAEKCGTCHGEGCVQEGTGQASSEGGEDWRDMPCPACAPPAPRENAKEVERVARIIKRAVEDGDGIASSCYEFAARQVIAVLSLPARGEAEDIVAFCKWWEERLADNSDCVEEIDKRKYLRGWLASSRDRAGAS